MPNKLFSRISISRRDSRARLSARGALVHSKNKPLLPIFNIYSINHFCKKHAHITAHRSRSRGAGRPGAAARSYYSILTVGARRTERHSRRAPSRHAWSAVCASNDAWQTPRGNLREADVQTSTIMRPQPHAHTVAARTARCPEDSHQ